MGTGWEGSIGAFLSPASRTMHGMGAWVGGGGVAYFPEPVTSFMVGCYMKWIWILYLEVPEPVMSLYPDHP